MKWLGGAGAATEPFCHLVYLWAEHGAHYAALIMPLLQRWRKEERGDGTTQRRERECKGYREEFRRSRYDRGSIEVKREERREGGRFTLLNVECAGE